jgi:hypothetical protein
MADAILPASLSSSSRCSLLVPPLGRATDSESDVAARRERLSRETKLGGRCAVVKHSTSLY